jgi:cell division protein FtsW (lipid II flippase)
VEFSGIVDGLISFAQNHTVIVIVVVLGLLFLAYRKPKLFFTLLFLGLFLLGVFYMITRMAGSSSEQKKRLIHEEKKQSDNIP